MSCVGVDMLVPVNAYIQIWNVQASEGITLGSCGIFCAIIDMRGIPGEFMALMKQE